jgi:hypothetical protein
MSEVGTFFRFCPGCGKRFHIKLVSKKLVDYKRETSEEKEVMIGGLNPMSFGYRGSMAPLIVQENIPITVEVEDFQYSYMCKHCGHEWAENRVKMQKED